MNTARTSLLAALVLVVGGCARDAMTTAPAPARDGFRLVSIEETTDIFLGNRISMPVGVFTFTNTTGKPLKVFAFDFPGDGETTLRFTEFQRLAPNGWRDFSYKDCDFIIRHYDLQPGRTYQLRVNLWILSGLKGMGRIRLPVYGGKPVIYSEPFGLTPIHWTRTPIRPISDTRP